MPWLEVFLMGFLHTKETQAGLLALMATLGVRASGQSVTPSRLLLDYPDYFVIERVL